MLFTQMSKRFCFSVTLLLMPLVENRAYDRLDKLICLTLFQEVETSDVSGPRMARVWSAYETTSQQRTVKPQCRINATDRTEQN